uniref:Uncharacterized protein n=1 Tax=Anguilla anguilla TaxID=7936 RepID=A0A0E9W3J8_ANGAN
MVDGKLVTFCSVLKVLGFEYETKVQSAFNIMVCVLPFHRNCCFCVESPYFQL